MPYITKEAVAEKRNRIKKEFPEFKISVTNENYSTINISIMSGPIDLKPKYNGHQVNPYGINDHYKEEPEIRDFLNRVYEIADKNNGVEVEDSDYGTVPNFYVRINIGKWDKPYEVK